MENSNYEKVNLDDNIPAMIKYVSIDTVPKEFHNTIMHYIPPHWHRSVELSLVVEGRVNLWINEQKSTIEANQFILVNSSQVHRLEEFGDEQKPAVVIMILSYDFIKNLCPCIDQFEFDLSKSNEQKDRLRDIYEEFKNFSLDHEKYDYLKMNAYLHEILYILLTFYRIDLPPDKIKNNVLYHQKQIDILTYIDEHSSEDLNLQMLADVFHMSNEHFSRMFHKYFGITFYKYLNHIRLDKAFDELLKSDNSVQNIARKHGFQNVKAFITTFKNEYGITPNKYRQQMNSNQ